MVREGPSSFFGGPRDSTLIYGMSACSGRPDLGVACIDKPLFRDPAHYFEHGFAENVMQPEQMTDMLAKLHVQYVVMQTGFHDDVAAVKWKPPSPLISSLKSNEFRCMPTTAMRLSPN
jgi:hypothetical protein